MIFPNFAKNISRMNKLNSSHLTGKMLGYNILSFGDTCSFMKDLKAHSFPQASLLESCSLFRTERGTFLSKEESELGDSELGDIELGRQ